MTSTSLSHREYASLRSLHPSSERTAGHPPLPKRHRLIGTASTSREEQAMSKFSQPKTLSEAAPWTN